MKLTVNSKGVWLDNHEVAHCIQLDIKNINPIERTEVVLHVEVDELDVEWASLDKLCQVKEKEHD